MRKDELRAAFVTHGGPGVGLGHVRRCLALAGAWSREGARTVFAMPIADTQTGDFVRRAGFETIPASWDVASGELYSELRARGVEIAVVDSYAASSEFLAALGDVVEQVVAVDDLADRPLPVHVVVNGGIAAEALPYDHSRGTLFLLGPRYALMDPRFAETRAREPRPQVGRVLIALGGGRQDAALAIALAAVRSALPAAEVHVMAGPFAAVDATAPAGGDAITVHRDPPDPRELMLGADVAIAGAGVTLYELAATGTPAIIVQMADNQGPNAAGFAGAGAALLAGAAGAADLGAGIEAALRRLGSPSDRALLAARARALVDGAGAARVAREISARVAAA